MRSFITCLQVFIDVTAKRSVFWDVMPYSLVHVHQLFEGTYCIHFHDRRVSQAGSKRFLFDSEYRGSRIALTGLHDVISQRMVIYGVMFHSSFPLE
jgi:hypothetical protein